MSLMSLMTRGEREGYGGPRDVTSLSLVTIPNWGGLRTVTIWRGPWAPKSKHKSNITNLTPPAPAAAGQQAAPAAARRRAPSGAAPRPAMLLKVLSTP